MADWTKTLQADIGYYAEKCRQHGYTKEEIMWVSERTWEEVRELSCHPETTPRNIVYVKDVLKKYHDMMVEARKNGLPVTEIKTIRL